MTHREAYVLAAHGHGAEAAAETLQAMAPKAWQHHGPSLRTVATEQPNLLPSTLRRVATDAGLDAEAVLLRTTRAAGRFNGRDIVPGLAAEPRYHADRNRKTPRRIDSTLDLYDCINCDLCIAACPNDAIFAYTAEPASRETELLEASGGEGFDRSPGKGFEIGEAHQLAVIEGACNECSNCEVYCPEEGAPFVVKERLFLDRAAFTTEAQLDGFCLEGDTLYARLDGIEMRFRPEPDRNRATLTGEAFHLELSWQPFEILKGHLTGPETKLDTALLWRAKTVWESIYEASQAGTFVASGTS